MYWKGLKRGFLLAVAGFDGLVREMIITLVQVIVTLARAWRYKERLTFLLLVHKFQGKPTHFPNL